MLGEGRRAVVPRIGYVGYFLKGLVGMRLGSTFFFFVGFSGWSRTSRSCKASAVTSRLPSFTPSGRSRAGQASSSSAIGTQLAMDSMGSSGSSRRRVVEARPRRVTTPCPT
jgi:hypothetical protein